MLIPSSSIYLTEKDLKQRSRPTVGQPPAVTEPFWLTYSRTNHNRVTVLNSSKADVFHGTAAFWEPSVLIW